MSTGRQHHLDDGSSSNQQFIVATALVDNTTSTSNPSSSRYNFKIGIYGWRKRCLYVLILILLVMVIVNLALTLWVLKVMEFSSDGMGQLKIVSSGLRLDGKAFILDTLVASSIKSRTGQPIVVESSENFTLSARNSNGFVNNQLFLGNNRLECLANDFRVLDPHGSTLLHINNDQVIVGAHRLRVTGEGGTVFKGSIQTTLVRAASGKELRLESPTRTVHLHGSQGVTVEARNGRINIESLNDITFHTEEGAIRLDAPSIVIHHLPTASPIPEKSSPSNGHDVFQLCICSTGKLFLAPSHAHCAHEEGDRVCR